MPFFVRTADDAVGHRDLVHTDARRELDCGTREPVIAARVALGEPTLDR